MRSGKTRAPSAVAWALCAAALAAADASAQARLVLPEGSVIVVRTETPLESATARAGQTFETTVAEAVGVDESTAIPAGSRIRGVVSFVQPATRQQAGVMEVNFDRLVLPGGRSLPISAKLTSTNAEERRQIESSPDPRVVLVGGRGGVGAAIAGAGSERSPASGILSALGALLSEGRDVRVPAGTPLAVQLEQSVTLERRGAARAGALTLYTGAERIRAAQQALARQNYYRGSLHGQLDDATQRALFEFQVDRGIVATGNLDTRTAAALGLSAGGGGAGAGAVLSLEEATLVRQGAQALVGRQRQELAVGAGGRLDTRRAYTEGDLELWFALSAFADNASLYEQVVRGAAGAPGAELAGRALIGAARRVDAAFQRTRPSTQLQGAWSSLRGRLGQIDAGYR